jgi:hypothetical protein
MLRIPHCLDSWLTDGGKVVSPTHWLCSTPQKLFYSASGTHFCQRLNKPQGLVWLEGLGKSKKFNDLIGTRSHDLPICGIVWQALCYHIEEKSAVDIRDLESGTFSTEIWHISVGVYWYLSTRLHAVISHYKIMILFYVTVLTSKFLNMSYQFCGVAEMRVKSNSHKFNTKFITLKGSIWNSDMSVMHNTLFFNEIIKSKLVPCSLENWCSATQLPFP